MEQKLNKYLRAGEQVRWQSRPENFPVLDGRSKSKILSKCALVVIVAAGLLAGHISSSGSPETGFVAVVLGVTAIVVCAPVLEKMQLMKCRYWITDQRVIQMNKDKLFYSMELYEIDAFKVMADGRAENCLVLGSSVFDDAEKYIRWRANTPKSEAETGNRRDHAEGLIFYNAADGEATAALLKTLGCARVA